MKSIVILNGTEGEVKDLIVESSRCAVGTRWDSSFRCAPFRMTMRRQWKTLPSIEW